MNTVVILGNGPSLRNLDLSILNNVDTFGLNGAYKHFLEMKWFPTYFALFNLYGPKKWDYKDLNNFVLSSHLYVKNYFFFKEARNQIIETAKTIFLNNMVPYEFYSNNLYTFPFIIDFQNAIKSLNKDEIKKVNLDKYYDTDENLNEVGIRKFLLEEPLDSSDYINKPRLEIEEYLPQSFDKFTVAGGVSSTIACFVAYLLKYSKIVLLGIDSQWSIRDKIVNEKQSYWFDKYFDNGYNLNDFCTKCDEKQLTNLHIIAWTLLRNAFEKNNVNIDIVNCTPNSKIDVFRKAKLKDEL